MGTNVIWRCKECNRGDVHAGNCSTRFTEGDFISQRQETLRHVVSARKANVCSDCYWTTGHSSTCPQLHQVPQEPSQSAPDLLQEAAALIKQRGVERDAEGGERSMKRTVDSFNAMTGHKLTEEDGWLFMMMLKLSRSRSGKIQPDDYKDLISYSALLGECALKGQDEPRPPS